MRVCLSFDDGRKDAYEAFKILKEHNLTASFHITTGFIDGSFKTDSFGKNREPLLLDELVEMHKYGMDISSHGDRHVMHSEDFQTSLNKLSKWKLVEGNEVGFSVPNSEYTEEELNNFISSNKNNLSYLRIGRSNKCYTLYSKIHYVIYHILHNQFSYDEFNKHNLMYSLDKYRLNALVIKKDTKVKNLINFINKYKDKDCTLIIMFHSIIDKPINKWEYSAKSFVELVKFLSKNIEVLTLTELTIK